MKTQSSPKIIWIRTLLLLPLLGVLLFSFSGRETIEKQVIQEKITIKDNLAKQTKETLNQDEATVEQVAEYNRLAKKYNTQSSNSEIIYREVTRINRLYRLMSYAQKKTAEPYPIFPPAPPAPPKPMMQNEETTTGFININGKNHFFTEAKGETKYYNRYGIEVDKAGNKLSANQTDGSKVIAGQRITRIYQNGKVVSEFKKTWNDEETIAIPEPPAPPSTLRGGKTEEERKHHSILTREANRINVPHTKHPKSTLEHIKIMSKKGADFYYNGDKITSDKALKLVKKNPKLNISSQTNNGKSTVHLSEKGMTIINGKAVNKRN